MQCYFNIESRDKDLLLKVTSLFAFSQHSIEYIPFCTPNNLKLRFWRGNNRLTIYLYQTIPIGVNNVVQIKYQDFIDQREGTIIGEVHKCFANGRGIKHCTNCNNKHTGGYKSNCNWDKTCERVAVTFSGEFRIPEGAIP